MYAATQIQNKIKVPKNSRIAQRNSIIFIGPIKSIDFENLNIDLKNNILFLKKEHNLKKNNKNFNKLIFRLLILNNFLNEKN